MLYISPYISEGSGLKPTLYGVASKSSLISPYISEGSGLKQMFPPRLLRDTDISPYISEGSGLKLFLPLVRPRLVIDLPLHQ